MQNEIYLIGEVGWEITLEDVISKVNKSDKTKPLNVHIHSIGGQVYDGLAIYKFLKELDQEVNTISSGLVASIASVIFLAGKKETRKIGTLDSFLIHLPSLMNYGTSDDFQRTLDELKNVEEKLTSIYTTETDITRDEVLELMKKDEMLSPEFLKEKGFVAEITEFKAVAKFDKNKNNNKMTKEDKGFFVNLFNKIEKGLRGGVTNKIVQDANGVEIDFYELTDTDTPSVGDKAKVDDKDATGEYTMPSGEVYVFDAGELTEIKPKEDTATAEIENLKKQLEEKENLIKSIDADFKELKSKITSSFDWENKKEKKEPRASRSMRVKK